MLLYDLLYGFYGFGLGLRLGLRLGLFVCWCGFCFGSRDGWIGCGVLGARGELGIGWERDWRFFSWGRFICFEDLRGWGAECVGWNRADLSAVVVGCL